MRVAALIIALVAPLLFPWPLTLVLAAGVSVVMPPAGILAGVLTDALYHTTYQALPYATLLGLLATLIGYLVHQFWKTRIMGA